MVKTCHKRISNIKQSSSRRTWPRINRRSEQSTLVSQTVGLTAGLEQQSDKSTCDRHVVVSWITPCSRAKVSNESDENSTTEVKYVNGSARIVG